MSQITSDIIKNFAKDIGFDYCGISKAEFLKEEASKLENWLKNNFHGKMSYMERNFDKRLDPTKLVEGAKSIISVLYNYYPNEKIDSEVKIAKYAWGEDYHIVIKNKLKELIYRIEEFINTQIIAFAYVDSAPVMDKVWAKKSGLGWIGKNTNLIHKKIGSFFFIAEIITDLILEPDSPIQDYCGTCTRCIDACPTEAIIKPYVIDSNKCISYLTIELRENIPEEFTGKLQNWIFGCDICQDVCPWNRFSKPHQEKRFTPLPILYDLKSLKDWEELTEEMFNKAFKNSPLKRSKFKGLKKNLNFVKKN